jgi:hypothetical protein
VNGKKAATLALASSAIRRPLPEPWRKQWKLRMRVIADNALLRNPLIRKREVWATECIGVPDLPFVLYVLTQGAPVSEPANRPAPTLRNTQAQWAAVNHRSVLDPAVKPQVTAILRDEIEQGILIRVRDGDGKGIGSRDMENMGMYSYMHPMGAVPKMDGTTQVGVRVIQNYAYPKLNSVNDFVSYFPVKFSKMDEVADYVERNPDCFAAKIDLSNYFRHLPIDPLDWPLLVGVWEFEHGWEPLIDTRMPFGLRHAPEVCCRFSAVVMFAVVRKVREKGFIVGVHVFIANVVDDWLVLAVTESICDMVWRMLRQLLKDLGFTVNEKPHKLSPPAQVGRWVGLQVDTVARMISLPEDKLVKGTALIKDMLARAHQHKSVTRRQVDKLIGYLSFCATVVYGGRAFLHRM